METILALLIVLGDALGRLGDRSLVDQNSLSGKIGDEVWTNLIPCTSDSSRCECAFFPVAPCTRVLYRESVDEQAYSALFGHYGNQ